jgi:hypothetical protein
MLPKAKSTQKDIIETAMQIVRGQGIMTYPLRKFLNFCFYLIITALFL